jgi:hypothetical protein
MILQHETVALVCFATFSSATVLSRGYKDLNHCFQIFALPGSRPTRSSSSARYLIGREFALKHEILNFAAGLIYIVLPLIFSFLMSVVGLGAAVAFAAIVSALQNPVQKAGRTAADEGKGLAKSAISRRP